MKTFGCIKPEIALKFLSPFVEFSQHFQFERYRLHTFDEVIFVGDVMEPPERSVTPNTWPTQNAVHDKSQRLKIKFLPDWHY